MTALIPGGSIAGQDAPDEVKIVYLSQKVKYPPVLSNLVPPPGDAGIAGARVAIGDNNTTGRFLKQRFTLVEEVVPVGGDASKAYAGLFLAGHRLFVLDLAAPALDKLLALPEASKALLFNAGASDDRFRTLDCRPSLLHTIPSRAMQADALAQYLVKKRWKKWFIVSGTAPGDGLYAKAVKRAARRFGAKIVKEMSWNGARDARRSAQAEVPLLTQGVNYDVLIVADEAGDFGEFLMYRTWDPRPVAGTQGLFATGWYWTMEQWGAAQLQRRFMAAAKRRMGPKDYAGWVAVRAIGEAATRTASNVFGKIIAYITGPKFQVAAFKGRKLSFRPWSGQLRQPMPVTAALSLITVSPQEGFLHQRTELDTLGYDKPETTCQR